MSRGSILINGMTYDEVAANYNRWMADTVNRQTSGAGRAQALLAASGVQRGSDIWNRRLETFKDEASTEIENLRTGITGRTVKGYASLISKADAGDKGGRMYGSSAERFTMLRSAKDIQARWALAGSPLENWEALSYAEFGEPDTVAKNFESAMEELEEGVFSEEEMASFFEEGWLTAPEFKLGDPTPPSTEELIGIYQEEQAANIKTEEQLLNLEEEGIPGSFKYNVPFNLSP